MTGIKEGHMRRMPTGPIYVGRLGVSRSSPSADTPEHLRGLSGDRGFIQRFDRGQSYLPHRGSEPLIEV